jgi:predicted methyltransferase
MKFTGLGILGIASLIAGCSRPAEAPPVAPAPPAPVEPAPVTVAPTPPPLTPEEEKKAKEQRELEADWKKLAEENAAEQARLTPELRAQTKTIADKSYGTARTALNAAIAGKHRAPGHAERDAARHPLETLEFFGFKPTQTVLEYGPGEGWYTELLAPALAKRGRLLVTNPDPNGPKDQRQTFYAERTKLFLERLPEAYGKVEPITIDPKAPKLGLEGTVDLVIVARALHGMNNNKQLGAWLAEFHKALKPNGILGIEQHRAAPTANPEESSKQGYLPEAWVIEQVQAAGFKLAGKSEINANPKDTKDYPEGVWALPPTFKRGETDKDKFKAIGESDRMTLKFVKVAEKKAPVAAAPAAKPAAPTTPAATPGTPAAAKPAAAPTAAAPAMTAKPAAAGAVAPATPAAPAAAPKSAAPATPGATPATPGAAPATPGAAPAAPTPAPGPAKK